MIILPGNTASSIAHQSADFPVIVSKLILYSFSIRFTESMLENNVVKKKINPNEMQKPFWKYCHGEDWKSVVKKILKSLKILYSMEVNS